MTPLIYSLPAPTLRGDHDFLPPSPPHLLPLLIKPPSTLLLPPRFPQGRRVDVGEREIKRRSGGGRGGWGCCHWRCCCCCRRHWIDVSSPRVLCVCLCVCVRGRSLCAVICKGFWWMIVCMCVCNIERMGGRERERESPLVLLFLFFFTSLFFPPPLSLTPPPPLLFFF